MYCFASRGCYCYTLVFVEIRAEEIDDKKREDDYNDS